MSHWEIIWYEVKAIIGESWEFIKTKLTDFLSIMDFSNIDDDEHENISDRSG